MQPLSQVTSTIAYNQTCTSQCYQPCAETRYIETITSSLWPRINSTDLLQAKYNLTYDSPEDYKDHLVMMQIYFQARLTAKSRSDDVHFQDLNYELIAEQPSMDMYDLLSNIGGTFGLFIGASFLTALEFVQLFARLITTSKAKRRRSAIHPRNGNNQATSDISLATNYGIDHQFP
jgi:hypothetical protein